MESLSKRLFSSSSVRLSPSQPPVRSKSKELFHLFLDKGIKFWNCSLRVILLVMEKIFWVGHDIENLSDEAFILKKKKKEQNRRSIRTGWSQGGHFAFPRISVFFLETNRWFCYRKSPGILGTKKWFCKQNHSFKVTLIFEKWSKITELKTIQVEAENRTFWQSLGCTSIKGYGAVFTKAP